jgi:glycosyltransferase involved in cell wall biosynthesis
LPTVRVGISMVTQGPDQTTGSRNIIREIVKELGRRAQVRVEVLCNDHALEAMQGCEGDRVELVRARVLDVGSSQKARVVSVAHARVFPGRMSRQFSPATDVTHYPMNFMVPTPRTPSVVVIHDVQHFDLPQHFSRAQRAWRSYFYRLAARRATMLITDSEHARLRAIEHLDVDPERVRGVHVAVDHERFSPDAGPDDERVLAELGVPESYVYYPASLWPHKNHLGLLDALGRLGGECPNLVLTGSGFGRTEEIEAAAATHGVADRLRYLGIVPDEALPVLYRHATATVFPSTYEGFGMPPAEAMSCGCPVASSLETSLAEVCGDAALPLDPHDPAQMADAIGKIVSDAALRERLREAGFDQAAKFTWGRTVDEHLEVFQRATELGG